MTLRTTKSGCNCSPWRTTWKTSCEGWHCVKHWSLTTLRENLIKIGAKVVSTARYVVFQMAEVAIPRRLFQAILERIRRLKVPSAVPG